MPRFFCCLILLLTVGPWVAPTVASDALQRIPENVLGFVQVRELEQTNVKVEQLFKSFDFAYPAPLPLAKAVTGLEAGLDFSGDLVIALLPGENASAAPIPFVLLPVDDYRAFANSINADTSGEICRATLAGAEILVAHVGTYALWMNVEHRGLMENLTALSPEPLTVLAPLADWLATQDVALVVMPAGMQKLGSWPAQSRAQYSLNFRQQQSMLMQLLPGVSTTRLRQYARDNFEMGALGVSVDRQSTVRLSEQLILKANSPWAMLSPTSTPEQTARLGLSDTPCVVSAGGPILPGWGEQLAKVWRAANERQAAVNGLKHVPKEMWEQEEAAFRKLLQPVQSCSVVMLPGTKGEPLLGNFLGVATVDDVSKYFDSLAEILKLWNEFSKQATIDFKPTFELVNQEVAGQRSCEIVVDIGTTARDPGVPVINWMIEATLGEEGKLSIKLAMVDETTFAFGLATPEQLKKLLSVVQKGGDATPEDNAMQSTLQLLNASAPWKFLVRPQGCLKWYSRFANEFLVLLTELETVIPEMADSPPLGLSVEWNGRHVQSELVCPAETWEALGKYRQTFNNR